MASTARVKVGVNGVRWSRRRPDSGADRALQCIAGGGNHLAPIVIAAMAADMMRPLQLAAVRAFMMRFMRQSLMGATHAAARRRCLAFRNCHGTPPLRSR